MKAAVGDRIVVVASCLGGPVREGRIVELRHEDGSPPYLVEWTDTGARGLYFPGPDGHLVHREAVVDVTSPASLDSGEVPKVSTSHVTTWNVTVHVFEHGDDTSARAVLHAGASTDLEGRGEARRNPVDRPVPEIGDEVAVARALRELSDALMTAAQQDMTGVG